MQQSVVTLSAFLFIVVLATACFQKAADEKDLPCQPGVQSVCFTGPENTRDVGVCRAGVQVCAEEGGEAVLFESCVGQVLPSTELCDGIDNNCDGAIDENNVCATETAENLEAQVGHFMSAKDETAAGAIFLAKPGDGRLYHCPEGGTLTDCSWQFLEEYGSLLGLPFCPEESPLPRAEDALEAPRMPDCNVRSFLQELNYVQMGELSACVFQQVHKEKRVLGGGVSIVGDATGIQYVTARIFPVPANLDVEPVVAIEDLYAELTPVLDPLEDDKQVGDLVEELVVYVPPFEGALLPTKWQTAHLAWMAVGLNGKTQEYERFLVDAVQGVPEVASETAGPWRYPISRASISRKVVDKKTNEWLTEEPGTGDDSWVATVWRELGHLYGFVTMTDPLKLDTQEPLPATDFKVTMLDSDGVAYDDFQCEGVTCDEGLLGCTDPQSHEITICDIADKKEQMEVILHEAFHNVTLNVGWVPWTFTDQSKAIVEFFAAAPTELLQCWRSLGEEPGGFFECDWTHWGLIIENDTWELGIDPNAETNDPRILAMAPLCVFKQIYKSNAAKFSPEESNILVQHLLFSSLKSLHPGVQFSGFFVHATRLCKRFVKDSVTVEVDGQQYSYEGKDSICSSLQNLPVDKKFDKLGLGDCSSKLDATETCNGYDDDCDGYVDNAPTGKMEDYSLTKTCWTGPAEALNESGIPWGECKLGEQQCLPGAVPDNWGDCEKEIHPAEEICDYLDNDCDGETDRILLYEEVVEKDGEQIVEKVWEELRTYYYRDLDADEWGDGLQSAFKCEPDTENGFVVETRQLEDGTVAFDCDDTDPLVFPALNEETICDVATDNDCDGVPDDGCECAPGEFVSNFCGKLDEDSGTYLAVKDECVSEAYEPESVEACTKGVHPSCKAGQTVCIMDPGTVPPSFVVSSECLGASYGSVETCDGEDNDCDGAMDEGLGQSTCGVGPCKHTVQNCVSGVPQVCQPFEGASSEVCDGKDNDCDGAVDDATVDTPSSASCAADGAVGWCASHGHLACQGGVVTCVSAAPLPEECDFQDRDCNGTPGVYDIVLAADGGPVPQECSDLIEAGSTPGVPWAVLWEGPGYTGCMAVILDTETCLDLGTEPFLMNDESTSLKVFFAGNQNAEFVLREKPCGQGGSYECTVSSNGQVVEIPDMGVMKFGQSGANWSCTGGGGGSMLGSASSVVWYVN